MSKCQKCDGCGQVANSESQEPWTTWASLPPGTDIAVRLGIVQPIDCPVCGGLRDKERVKVNVPQKFRNKPVVIEAMQWDGSAESATPIIDWAIQQLPGANIRYHEHLMDGDLIAHPAPFLWVDTLEGRMIANAGDFIIRGVNGEFHPCKPDIFAETYDAAEA